MHLKEERKKISAEGKEILQKYFSKLKIEFNDDNLQELIIFLKLHNSQDLFYRAGIKNIDLKQLQEYKKAKARGLPLKKAENSSNSLEEIVSSIRGDIKPDMFVIGESLQKINYKLSPCCHPIPGDDVVGFTTPNQGIIIHRVNCPNAIKLMSNYAYRIVKAKWTNQEMLSFLAGIKVKGFDEVGIVNNITKIISNELNVNMRSLSFDSNDGVFEGTIMVFVQDTNHLTDLIKKLSKVQGVSGVTRIDTQ